MEEEREREVDRQREEERDREIQLRGYIPLLSIRPGVVADTAEKMRHKSMELSV